MKRPQLTMRDWFWLVVVVAIALGWGLERRWHQQRIGVLEAKISWLERRLESQVLLQAAMDELERRDSGYVEIPAGEREARIKAILSQDGQAKAPQSNSW